jgi:hypothetical protein
VQSNVPAVRDEELKAKLTQGNGGVARLNNKGSSGRARTYNPPVNRGIEQLLPCFTGLGFKLLHCALAQEFDGLTFVSICRAVL